MATVEERLERLEKEVRLLKLSQAAEIDLAAKKLIVVKSSQHFYASFSKVAKKVIYVAAPGAVTVDLKTLPYKKIQRSKWPID